MSEGNRSENNIYYDGYNLNQTQSVFRKVIITYKSEGINILIKKIIIYFFYKMNYLTLNRYFNLDNHDYRYFCNLYNAVVSERVAEISIARRFLNEHQQDDILEIGNVLSHYFDFPHIIIDKYEKHIGIENIDIIDYSTEKKFKAIISISTIEHIGFDEPVSENGKSLKAIRKLMELLEEGGEALITVPLGYNPEIDEIVQREFLFSQQYFLKRISRLNLWKQTDLKDALKYKYNSIYPAGNAIAILYLKNIHSSSPNVE